MDRLPVYELGAVRVNRLGMVQLDVASLTAVTHLFAQDMRTRGRGKILLVASLLAYQGVQNFAVYAAAKA